MPVGARRDKGRTLRDGRSGHALKILTAEFIASVAIGGRIQTAGLPVVALVGRSNVGKSSLINALTQSRLARTGGAAGTTRLLNVYRVRVAAGPRGSVGLTVIDFPGYGYARGGEETRQTFDELTQDFFDRATRGSPQATRDEFRLAVVVLVVDARHPGLESDLTARSWLADRGHPLLTVITKIDKLKSTKRVATVRKHTALLGTVTEVSSRMGDGISEVWSALVGQLL